MSAPTRYPSTGSSPYEEFDRYFDTKLTAGERVGDLPPRRSSGFSRFVIVLLTAVAGGWAYLSDPSILTQWLPAEISSLLPSADRKPAASAEATASAIRPPELPANPEAARASAIEAPAAAPLDAPLTETATVADTAAASADSAVTSATLQTETTAEDAAPPERLPPPVVDLSDPYQRKATAVGLHPELSRALLEKLTPADYRNAGIAIKTALAETPDSEVHVWPRERKGGIAVFQVKFVPGAPADCRRYVVAIIKDGWQTTALPMERCGIKPVRGAARVSPAPERAHSSAP